jgi:hypothetical protein
MGAGKGRWGLANMVSFPPSQEKASYPYPQGGRVGSFSLDPFHTKSSAVLT